MIIPKKKFYALIYYVITYGYFDLILITFLISNISNKIRIGIYFSKYIFHFTNHYKLKILNLL